LDHLRAWGIETVDVVAGGVPCQPFSRAGSSRLRGLVRDGHRSADDARAHLWDAFLKVVHELRPRAVLVENVPDLAAWKNGAVLVGLQEGLLQLGFRTEARVLAAYEYDVPQFRSRLFVVGVSGGLQMRWPASSPRRNTLRDAIGDLPTVGGDQRKEVVAYSGAPESDLQRRLRRGITRDQRDLVLDHITRAVRPDDAEAFSLLRPGQTYRDLPARLQRYRSDIFRDKYKRLEWDGLSRTITAHIAKDGYWYIHPEMDRTLSIREAARLQTFPDWYRFAGPPSVRFRQIGNGVPPLLAEAVGRSLKATMDAGGSDCSRHRTVSGFSDALLAWHRAEPMTHPWRGGAEPWHVLMAELCLQRTPSSDVTDAYRHLIRVAPGPQALTESLEEDVHTALAPLRLGRRVHQLLTASRVLVEECGGRVPDDENDLGAIPGVGEYVANAVLTFGFRRSTVLLDANTERVTSRVCRGGLSAGRWQTRVDLHSLAGPRGPDPAFNAAILALGRAVCCPSRPRCIACPVVRHCATGSTATCDAALAGPSEQEVVA
jgi:DNA (cytosine-5)-methyltransferase 1